MKRFYPISHKGKHAQGIGKGVQRERLIHLIKSRSVQHPLVPIPKLRGRKRIAEVLPPTSPTIHHHISAETRERVDIYQFLDEHEGDPALEVSPSLLFFLDNSLIASIIGLLSSIT